MNDALTTAVHALMREAAERAILPRYRTLAAHEIVTKSAYDAMTDVVTIADHEAEAILGEGLARLLPEASIVGEEAVEADPAVLERLGDALCWIVDPLDGTNNFAAGKPPFGILIALAEYGETIAGWIYDVLTGRFCHATRDGGAFPGTETRGLLNLGGRYTMGPVRLDAGIFFGLHTVDPTVGVTGGFTYVFNAFEVP